MPTQRLATVASGEQGGCWVEVDFGNNDQATLARWMNNLDRPVRAIVILPNGKQVFDGTIDASGGTDPTRVPPSGTFPLEGADRFNVTQQSPSVNLSPWSTPASP